MYPVLQHPISALFSLYVDLKRKRMLITPSEPHAPHAHPMAPVEIAKDFQSFLAKIQSSSTSPESPSSNPKTQTPEDSKHGKVDRTTESGSATVSGAEKEDVWKGKPAPPVDYELFWEAPEHIWKQKEWTEREIEAVMVSSQSGSKDPRGAVR